MSFAVWVTGPEQAGVETVADEVARSATKGVCANVVNFLAFLEGGPLRTMP